MQQFDALIRRLKNEVGHEKGWFDKSDLIYCQYILNISIYGQSDLLAIADEIVNSVDSEGFFLDVSATKSHNKFHKSALAIATLELIEYLTDSELGVKNSVEKINNNINYLLAYPSKLTYLDKVHMWRGSHTFGGIAALKQFCVKYELCDDNDVLDFYFSIIRNDATWKLVNPLISSLFDLLYQFKHNPSAAYYGAAAHLFWLKRDYSGLDRIDPNLSVTKLLDFYRKAEIIENVPYCLDYDLLYILRFLVVNFEIEKALHEQVLEVFYKVGVKIIYFLNNNQEMWLHAFPGALAALQVCCFTDKLLESNPDLVSLRDPMDITLWL